MNDTDILFGSGSGLIKKALILLLAWFRRRFVHQLLPH